MPAGQRDRTAEEITICCPNRSASSQLVVVVGGWPSFRAASLTLGSLSASPPLLLPRIYLPPDQRTQWQFPAPLPQPARALQSWLSPLSLSSLSISLFPSLSLSLSLFLSLSLSLSLSLFSPSLPPSLPPFPPALTHRRR